MMQAIWKKQLMLGRSFYAGYGPYAEDEVVEPRIYRDPDHIYAETPTFDADKSYVDYY